MIEPVYSAREDRYDGMSYERCGRSGVLLSRLSLGMWHNFGATTPLQTGREIMRYAFDHGITSFDLANNYGPPYGTAEESFGQIFARDFRPYRDEMFISTKAGYDMWPGPYGNWGSRKYLMASLDQSLRRMGLDYVDVFYSHRYDPSTPLDETLRALVDIVRSGKALYAAISRWPKEAEEYAFRYLDEHECHCLLYQDRINILDRATATEGRLPAAAAAGVGYIAFSPLAQGLLTGKYLSGTVPAGSRMSLEHFLHSDVLTPQRLASLRELNAIAEGRGQTLAQMATSWVLAQPGVTSAIVGCSSAAQLADTIRCTERLEFTPDEFAAIDRAAGV